MICSRISSRSVVTVTSRSPLQRYPISRTNFSGGVVYSRSASSVSISNVSVPLGTATPPANRLAVHQLGIDGPQLVHQVRGPNVVGGRIHELLDLLVPKLEQ